jgi:ABC-type dipeptide/oligopeptide/nickel transport system permease subunit
MPRSAKIAASVLVLIAIISLLSPVIAPDPDKIDLDALKESPSLRHPLGTDQKGRDILARVIAGGRVSLGVAMLSVFISMSIGLFIGLISGYYGGRLDSALMALVDLIMSFPSLLLAIGISLLFKPGIITVMIAIASVGWASFARLIRGHVLVLKEATYIEAARAVGAGNGRIIIFHLLPQCISLAVVLMGLRAGGYILTEASLSFLGLGAQPPQASWGSMISAGRTYIITAPWIAIAPGVAILITALAFNILGDGLSERFGIKR